MSHGSDEMVPPQLIEDELERVLASRGFRGSARKRRFLQFIVETAQAGHADRIKAYTIAVDVFDRDPSFDPLTDPVVRVEGGRLRRCLEQYYQTEGAANPVQITIPKGGYVPRFILKRGPVLADGQGRSPDQEALPEAAEQDEARLATAQRAAPPPPSMRLPLAVKARRPFSAAMPALLFGLLLIAAWGAVLLPLPRIAEERTTGVPLPSLMVLPLTNGSGDPAQDLFAQGFTEDLIGALISFKSLTVFGDDDIRDRSAPARSNVSVTYLLKGSVNRIGDQVRINIALMHGGTGRYIWSDSVQRDIGTTDPLALRQDIAVQIARALAQPQGVIATEEMRIADTSPTGLPSSAACPRQAR